MLSREDNELLCRVGRGTPMGNLMREYWIPCLPSSEFPEPDSPVKRMTLLGENFVMWRDTKGRMGAMSEACPHRGASMYFARNEDCGLRCVYHGWKFDIEGNCIDMPSEPEGSGFRDKVRLKAYPTVERGGMVWTYMGPPECQPGPPDFEWLRAPETHRHISKVYERCNYLQALEGGLDSSHSSFVHNERLGDNQHFRNRDRAPVIEVDTTDYGFLASSTRRLDDENHYVRVYHYVLPSNQFRAGTTQRTGGRYPVPKLDGHIWVPIDDHHTWVYNWAYSYDSATPLTPEYMETWDRKDGRAPEDFIPGTFELKQNIYNDYLIDRDVQKTKTFSGIKGVNTQDYALQEGMGPIVDRTREHLGSSDRTVIAMRRMLLEAVSAVEQGDRPKGADPALTSAIRPHDDVIPADADWREVFAGEMIAKW